MGPSTPHRAWWRGLHACASYKRVIYRYDLVTNLNTLSVRSFLLRLAPPSLTAHPPLDVIVFFQDRNTMALTNGAVQSIFNEQDPKDPCLQVWPYNIMSMRPTLHGAIPALQLDSSFEISK